MLPTTAVQPTNITITTLYSIKVEEQNRMTVDDVFKIRDECIEAMNILATNVLTQLWFNEKAKLEKSLFHDRLFVELPTAVDIEDIGFTSSPELISKDFDSGNRNDDDDKNSKIFVGGPCPTEMMFEQMATNQRRQYSCLQVRASILIYVLIDDNFIETDISADDVQALYSDSLEHEIMRGELAYIFKDRLQNSTVIMATGQTVPTKMSQQTEGPVIRVAVIVGLVAGGLLLIMILLHLGILRRKRRNHYNDEKGNTITAFASVDTSGEEDLEAKNLSMSGKLGAYQEDGASTVTGSTKSGNGKTSAFSVQSRVGQQQQQHRRTHNEHGDTKFLMTQSVPYFQTDTSPGSIIIADDAKSIGCISAESEAGWSEAYTSSMGSASDDGICGPDSPLGSDVPDVTPSLMSLSMGPNFPDIETDVICGVSPIKDSQTPINITPTIPTSPNSETIIAPTSPITPKSIQLLEETTSDNDNDEILIHEDFSDEDDEDNDDKNVSHDLHKQSSEKFRAKVHALIERIVPEELEQIDDMISQFKNREDELLDTLLAMQKRSLAQKQTDASSSPSSPIEKYVSGSVN